MQIGEESRADSCARPCFAASCGEGQVDRADLADPSGGKGPSAGARSGEDALGNGNFDAAVRISFMLLSGDDGLDASVA